MFNPAPEYVLVEQLEQDEVVTASGIIVSGKVIDEIEKLREGKILAIGYDAGKNGYQVGDKIVYSKYATTVFKDEYVLNYKDIVGRLTE